MTSAARAKNKSGFADLKSFVLSIGSKAGSDNLPRLSSSFSFFALLSLAPFLVLAVTIGALILGRDKTAESLLTEAAHVGGPQVKDYLSAIIQSSQHRASGIVATVLSLLVTFYSASNLFLNLDDAINTIWKKTSNVSFVKGFIITRLVAFFSVILFGAVLLGWLIMDSALGYIAHSQGGFRGWEVVSYLVSILFFTLAFSITLHLLPRNHLTLRDAIPGAFVTSIAFTTSRVLLTYYFVGGFGVYKAAGGIVVLLLWMYYSAMIYFIGVEITYAYSHRYGSLKDQGSDLEKDLQNRGLPAS